MRKWRSAAWFLSLSVVTLAIVDACSSGAEKQIGRMMVDAGTAMVDAGGSNTPQGGAGRDASNGSGKGDAATADRDAGILADAGRALIDAGTAMMDAGSDAGADAAAQSSKNKSGSRIQLQRTTQTGDDGTVYEYPFFTYHDTQLDADCNPTQMSDGTKRCTPSGQATFLYFSDSSCMTRLAVAPGTCTTAKFVAETISPMAPSCDPSYMRIYQAGGAYSGTVYIKSGASCVTTTPLAGYTVYSVGAELQPSDLVEFTESVETL